MALLPDVQSNLLENAYSLDKVGICGMKMPVGVQTKAGKVVQTVAKVSVYCSLGDSQRGAHMSRFPRVLLQAFEEFPIASAFLTEAPQRIREVQGAENSYIKLRFPYQITNISPQTKLAGPAFVDVILEAVIRGESSQLQHFLTVEHQVIAVCPCSKELSLALEEETGERGVPHMQRSYVTVTVEFSPSGMVWIEDLVSVIESVAPVPYFIVKRLDEQEMARVAWECTNFVEDIARGVVEKLESMSRVLDYVVVTRNKETIHNFDVVAVRCKGVAGGLR